MNKYECPMCGKPLDEQEALIFAGSEDTEPIWVCLNLDCDLYDQVVYNLQNVQEMDMDDNLNLKQEVKK